MEDNIILYLAIILVAGLIFGRLAKLVKLPNVTGYLVGGLIIGPYVLGLIPADIAGRLEIISTMALAFIAFTIGTEFKFSYFKRVGMTPIIIAILEAMGAAVLVTIALILIAGQDLPFAILLGAIASATAPAATIMVIKQYRAKGPVTQTLLSVVALDDAVALIAFGFAVTISKALVADGSGSLAMSIAEPFIEIGLSILVGFVCGFILRFPFAHFKSRGNKLAVVIAVVFLTAGLADLVGASSLLTCMIMGATFTNTCSSVEDALQLTDYLTPPLFLMFFVVSGAELNISIIPTIGLVGITYVIVRVLGKILGAYAGAKLMKAPKTVQRYLGPTLIPQAGVAIGLTVVAQSVVPEHGATITAVILCATLIYELVGPSVTKFCLKKAGETQKEV